MKFRSGDPKPHSAETRVRSRRVQRRHVVRAKSRARTGAGPFSRSARRSTRCAGIAAAPRPAARPRAPCAGDLAVRPQLGQRCQHERALRGARMRHGEALVRDDDPAGVACDAVQQHVQVQRARRVAIRPLAAEALLDRLQGIEQGVGRKRRAQACDRVDVVGAARIDGRASIQRRRQKASRRGEPLQFGQRGAQRGARVAEVGAQADEDRGALLRLTRRPSRNPRRHPRRP